MNIHMGAVTGSYLGITVSQPKANTQANSACQVKPALV